MAENEKNQEPNLFGIFVGKASRLIDNEGLFVAVKKPYI